MGQWFARFLSKEGFEIILSDKDQDRTVFFAGRAEGGDYYQCQNHGRSGYHSAFSGYRQLRG